MNFLNNLTKVENTARVVALLALLMSFVPGCASLDNALLDVKQEEVITPATSNLVTQVTVNSNSIPVINTVTNAAITSIVNGVTNWSFAVITSTNWTVNVNTLTNYVWNYVPASTNLVVKSVEAKDAVKTGVDLAGALPVPYAGTFSALAALFLQGYVSARRKKMVQSLTHGIENFRNAADISSDHDQTLVENLSSAQKAFGVTKEIADMLKQQGMSK